MVFYDWCTWHHKTFLEQLYRHLAILYCVRTRLQPQTQILQMKVCSFCSALQKKKKKKAKRCCRALKLSALCSDKRTVAAATLQLRQSSDHPRRTDKGPTVHNDGVVDADAAEAVGGPTHVQPGIRHVDVTYPQVPFLGHLQQHSHRHNLWVSPVPTVYGSVPYPQFTGLSRTHNLRVSPVPVSYTHLTLPTNRLV